MKFAVKKVERTIYRMMRNVPYVDNLNCVDVAHKCDRQTD